MYPVLNPATVGRATRDLARLHQEIVQLAVEAANGVVDEGDASKIEQDLISYRQLGEALCTYVRAVHKQAVEKATEQAKAAEAAKPKEEGEPQAEKA